MAQMATATRLQHTSSLPPDEVIFGRSESMGAIRNKVEKIISASIPVLIQGESGTGKEVIARLIHQRSSLADGPLVKVNCPAIPGTLLESELFGYEQGAFTDAHSAKPGRVEAAHGGVLFLDEIGDLDLGLQAKLLQFLQDGQFCRLGGQDETRVELRVICATNRPLEQEVESGAFRQDLFYRINVVNLQLPPLRERKVDIPELVTYFLDFYNAKFNLKTRPVSGQTLRLMQSYNWPGNVRELENMVKRYVILGSEESLAGELVNHSQMPVAPTIPPDGHISLKRVTREAVRELERQLILASLKTHHWNRKKAARHLGISYRAMLYKLREFSLAAEVDNDPTPADAAD